MATHSRILAWRISWTEEPGRLQVAKSYTNVISFAPLFFYGMRQGKEKGETIIPKVLDPKILKVRFPTLPF